MLPGRVGLPQLRFIHLLGQLGPDGVFVPGTVLGVEGTAVKEAGKALGPRSLQSPAGADKPHLGG